MKEKTREWLAKRNAQRLSKERIAQKVYFDSSGKYKHLSRSEKGMLDFIVAHDNISRVRICFYRCTGLKPDMYAFNHQGKRIYGRISVPSIEDGLKEIIEKM